METAKIDGENVYCKNNNFGEENGGKNRKCWLLE